MIRFLLALLAIALLLVAAGEASAHDGVVAFRDGHGNLRFVSPGYGYGVQSFHVHPQQFRSFNNRSFFNQNGGRNRLGFRR